MRRIGRCRLQCQADRLGDFRIPDLPWRAWAGLVVKPVDAVLGEASAPFADRIFIGAEGARDHLVFHALGRREHNPSSPRQSLRCATTARQARQLSSLCRLSVRLQAPAFPSIMPPRSEWEWSHEVTDQDTRAFSE